MFRRTDCHFSLDRRDLNLGCDRYTAEKTALLNARDGRVYLDAPSTCRSVRSTLCTNGRRRKRSQAAAQASSAFICIAAFLLQRQGRQTSESICRQSPCRVIFVPLHRLLEEPLL